MSSIPQSLLDRYVERFPHLRTLAANAAAGMRAAELSFARNALRLEVPQTVTVREVWHLAGVAEGVAWGT